MSNIANPPSPGREEPRLRKRGFPLEGFTRDLRFTLRQLIRRPGFTFVIVFTLAVGIGPNVAIFSVLKALVLQPLPYPEPDRLVQVWETDIDGRWRQPFSWPDYLDIREQSTSFEEFGVHTPRAYNLDGDEPERVMGVMGTASVLRAYGIPPVRGRLFTEAEEEEGNNHVVILSDKLWKRRYEADPAVVGETVTINGEGYHVVGIMPEDFEFLSPWTFGTQVELWTPIVPSQGSINRGSHWILGIGRLKPGVKWRAAEAEIRTIAERLQAEYPNSNARTQVWLNPFLIQVIGDMSGQLLVLLGAVGLVLLIACANVASMLLAKGAGRQNEVAIRASLGAGRRRIVGQLLTESVLLSLLGGAAGVLLGMWSIGLLRGLIPPEVPRIAGIRMDEGVLIFTFGLALVTGLVFGLVPALTASRTNIIGALREGSGSLAGGKKRNRMLRRLAVAQLAVAFMLTNGAALLFRSYQNVLQTDQVFDTEQVLTANISLSGNEYAEDEVRVAFWERLIEQVEALPEVERAAVTTKLPLEGGTNGWVLVGDQTYDPDVRGRLVEYSYVTPGFFEAMGIPLLAGRIQQRGDEVSTERIALVNRAFVELYEQFWPEGDPLGQRVRSNSDPPVWTALVVGVVESVRQWGPAYRPLPEMYFPYSVNPWGNSKLIVRSGVDPISLVPAIRGEVLKIDYDQPLSGVRTMGQVITGAMRSRQFLLMLVSLFAVIALILAIAGIFGIMSYNVAQRTREIGVRVAFGAIRNNLISMILWEALRLALIGVAAGVFLIFTFATFIRSQLYGVGPLNLVSLSIVAIFMAAIALMASGVPALRTTRVDPILALRTE